MAMASASVIAAVPGDEGDAAAVDAATAVRLLPSLPLEADLLKRVAGDDPLGFVFERMLEQSRIAAAASAAASAAGTKFEDMYALARAGMHDVFPSPAVPQPPAGCERCMGPREEVDALVAALQTQVELATAALTQREAVLSAWVTDLTAAAGKFQAELEAAEALPDKTAAQYKRLRERIAQFQGVRTLLQDAARTLPHYAIAAAAVLESAKARWPGRASALASRVSSGVSRLLGAGTDDTAADADRDLLVRASPAATLFDWELAGGEVTREAVDARLFGGALARLAALEGAIADYMFGADPAQDVARLRAVKDQRLADVPTLGFRFLQAAMGKEEGANAMQKEVAEGVSTLFGPCTLAVDALGRTALYHDVAAMQRDQFDAVEEAVLGAVSVRCAAVLQVLRDAAPPLPESAFLLARVALRMVGPNPPIDALAAFAEVAKDAHTIPSFLACVVVTACDVELFEPVACPQLGFRVQRVGAGGGGTIELRSGARDCSTAGFTDRLVRLLHHPREGDTGEVEVMRAGQRLWAPPPRGTDEDDPLRYPPLSYTRSG